MFAKETRHDIEIKGVIKKIHAIASKMNDTLSSSMQVNDDCLKS